MDCVQNDILDERLLELAMKAQEHQRGSKQRRLALKELINEIQRQSGRLIRPNSNKYPSKLCQEIFDIAYQRLLVFIYHPDKNIERYNHDKARVIGWLNIKLDRRFFEEAKNQLVSNKNISVEDWAWEDNQQGEELYSILVKEEPPCSSMIVRQCIEEDSEGIFEKKHIKDNPEATFQKIAIKRLDGESWQDISDFFGIKALTTTSTFYHRCITKFAPIIKQLCTD